jgi:2-desacetyl-2-hydroxyethyl bacteriochlorophyllide A dehydrogenase
MKTKILVFEDKFSAAFAERVLPEPSHGEFLVRNSVSLVSPGTELALYTGTHVGFADPDIAWAAYPMDIGYASAGEVIASRSEGFPEGARVIHYGPHAPFSLVGPATTAHIIPKGLDEKTACFGRFAQIAYSAAAACTRDFGSVAVYGAGIVGNLAAQWFSVLGAGEVTVRDPDPARRETAARCGLKVESGTPPGPAETVVEATGVPAVVNEALERAAVGGQVVLLGSTRGAVEINVYKSIHRKALVLSGAHETVLGDRALGVLGESLDRLAAGDLNAAPMMTHVIGPDDLTGIYDKILAAPQDYLGVHVDWSGRHD